MTNPLWPPSVLPPRASEIERALCLVDDIFIQEICVNVIRWVKDPDTCPAKLLPWLAWEYRVDTWNSDWTEQEKRNAIKRAPFIHRHRGTIAAVRRALADSPFDVEIVEWFEQNPPARPYTFRLDIAQKDLPVTPEDYQDLKYAILRTKNVRSWFSVHVSGSKTGTVYGYGLLRARETLHQMIFPTVLTLNPSPVYLAPGDEADVTVSVLPERADNRDWTLSVAQNAVAEVSVSGPDTLHVTGLNYGDILATADAVRSDASAQLQVFVTDSVIVSINITDLSLPVCKLANTTEPVIVLVDGIPVQSSISTSTGSVYITDDISPGLHRVTIANSKTMSFNFSTPVNNLIAVHRFSARRASMRSVFSDCKYLIQVDQGAFDNLGMVTDFSYLFQGCISLPGVPADLFSHCPLVTNFTGLFSDCTVLSAIPPGLFDNNPRVTSFTDAFNRCQNIPSIPPDLFASCPLVTQFIRTFNTCTKLAAIPPGLFDNNPLVTSFASVFEDCPLITEVPQGLFDHNINVTSFSGSFRYCDELADVPDDLFASCTNVTNYSSVFYWCWLLAAIPSSLAASPKVTTFNSAFYDCRAITTIPDGLFDNAVVAKDFGSVFRGCIALINVPDRLFSNTAATNMSYAFYQTTALTTVPADIFSGCNGITDFQYLFYQSGLTVIPDTIFTDCVAALNMNFVFYGTSITAIPQALFSTNLQVTSYNYAFGSCFLLTDVPDDLLASAANAVSMTGFFSGCKKIPTVPATVFSGLTSKMKDISQVFTNCDVLQTVPSGLFSGASLTTMRLAFNNCVILETDLNVIFPDASYATVTNVQSVFYGCKKLTGTGAAFIAKFPAGVSSTSALRNCTTLSDYASLPSTWK